MLSSESFLLMSYSLVLVIADTCIRNSFCTPILNKPKPAPPPTSSKPDANPPPPPKKDEKAPSAEEPVVDEPIVNGAGDDVKDTEMTGGEAQKDMDVD